MPTDIVNVLQTIIILAVHNLATLGARCVTIIKGLLVYEKNFVKCRQIMCSTIISIKFLKLTAFSVFCSFYRTWTVYNIS